VKHLDLVIYPRAQADIDEEAAKLDDYQTGAGSRFLAEFAHIAERLVTFPHFGQLWDTTQPDRLSRVRRVLFPSFRSSVFYRSSETTITVLRVLHHARDVAPLLDDL